METFCTKSFLVQGFSIAFHPDKKKSHAKKRKLMRNIPPETPENLVT